MTRRPQYLVDQQRRLGRYLAALREAAGLVQADVARAVPCHRTTVAHAEAASQLPDSHFWEIADQVVGADGALIAGYDDLISTKAAHAAEQRIKRRTQARADAQALGHAIKQPKRSAAHTLPSGASVDLDSALERVVGLTSTSQAEGVDGVDRRSFLGTSITAGISAAIPESTGRRIGIDLIDALRKRNARLQHLDDFLGGAQTYPLYKTELTATIKLVRNKSYTGSTREALLGILSEQAQQAGWAAFDSGHNSIAREHFNLALSAAREANCPSLAGNSLAFMAYQQVSLGRPAIDLAEASCQVAGHDAPTTVRALLWERTAWTFAKSGKPKETERALARANQALHEGPAVVQPHWSRWVDQQELKIMTGRCWSELRRPLRAVEPLETALADFDDTHARDKALYLSWLADAYIDGSEIEQAASTIERAFELGVGVGSIRPRNRINSVLVRLRKHRELSSVRAILDRADSSS